MKTLITGITGMIGSHFARAAQERKWPTYGIARNSASSRLSATPDPNVFRIDILDRDALEETLLRIEPDLVIHMAAQAFNSISWQTEESTHLNNYQGTVNVLRTCQRAVPEAKVLIACSSAEYGDIAPEDCPLKEERFLRPITPYGVSKAATECLGYQYFANYGLEVFLPRLFIHVGTGHPPATAIQNFARQLALIAKGHLEPVVNVGNLESARDFIDVRDGVDGMMLLLEKGEPGVPVNICTGTAHKISDILKMLIEISGLDIEVVKDTSLLRPSDEPLLLGDNSRLKNLGWRQKYSIEQTLEAVYKDWLDRI
ncbi:MAG: NAD-dependent epimerase/dehydratase family protein [Proteobacteria bacterium]|nr:NAD-dependent epimerase/dehydratase family protein [Pseudomonadota bacterium]